MIAGRPRRRSVSLPVTLLVALGAGGLSGCELFEARPGVENPVAKSTRDAFGRPAPDAQAMAKDVVHLEIVFVERPANDPLLGKALWRDLDEVGSLKADVRQRLARNGLRVGQCGSTPPPALQTLLGLQPQIVETGDGARPKLLTGRPISLPDGAEYEVQTSELRPTRTVRVEGVDGPQTYEYEQARCVLRLKATRLQAGWVKIDFQPEVHHGANQLRRVADENGYQLRQSQEVEPLFGQRFTMELNTNEMVVVSASDAAGTSVGRHFFQQSRGNATLQRALVVRVAGLTKAEPVAVER